MESVVYTDDTIPAATKPFEYIHPSSSTGKSTPKGRNTVVSDEDDEEAASSPPLKLSKKGQPLAKFGRPSFGENTVNKKYNSRYRNADNKNKLASTNERERIFRSAAWYALADEDVEEIMSMITSRVL